MLTERFELRNDPPRKLKGLTFDNGPNDQRKLFTGLDCLPGQRDLFDVDGMKEGARQQGDQ